MLIGQHLVPCCLVARAGEWEEDDGRERARVKLHENGWVGEGALKRRGPNNVRSWEVFPTAEILWSSHRLAQRLLKQKGGREALLSE